MPRKRRVMAVCQKLSAGKCQGVRGKWRDGKVGLGQQGFGQVMFGRRLIVGTGCGQPPVWSKRDSSCQHGRGKKGEVEGEGGHVGRGRQAARVEGTGRVRGRSGGGEKEEEGSKSPVENGCHVGWCEQPKTCCVRMSVHQDMSRRFQHLCCSAWPEITEVLSNSCRFYIIVKLQIRVAPS